MTRLYLLAVHHKGVKVERRYELVTLGQIRARVLREGLTSSGSLALNARSSGDGGSALRATSTCALASCGGMSPVRLTSMLRKES